MKRAHFTGAAGAALTIALFLSSGGLQAQTLAGGAAVVPAPASASPVPAVGGPTAKSFSQEAPASDVAPADPRDISSVWTWRNNGPRAEPVYQPGVTPPPPPPAVPDPTQLCVPLRFFGSGTYPTQIVQTPGQVTIIQEENHRIRRIYLDQPQPSSTPLTYGGHSVGHWEGDTLIVDTRFFRSTEARPMPADAIVTERLRKLAGGRVLEWKVTTESASAYVSPRTETIYLNWRPDLHIQEQICEENSEAFGDSYWDKDGGK